MSDPDLSGERPSRTPWRELVGTGAGALAITLATSAGAEERWFPPDSSHWFAGWRSQLQELVDRRHDASASDLCVVGWENGDPSSLQAYVFWAKGRELITWRPSADDPHSLVDETNVTDLERDVVANGSEVHGSTYLVTRGWVERIRSHCRRYGTTVRLSPRIAPPGL